ncbi:hypothetical protein [Nocardiopsis alkaliphila]|nr:hypothetical protein [Nocardiopsis alkaliphila]
MTGPDLQAFRKRLGSAREPGEIFAGIDPDPAVEMLNGPFRDR